MAVNGYKIIEAFVRCAYSFIEGDDREYYWMDSQNCYYHVLFLETDANFRRNDGKRYWIIEPYKPKDLVITEENYNEVKSQIKWFVACTSDESDLEKEWDFERHCVKGEV